MKLILKINFLFIFGIIAASSKPSTNNDGFEFNNAKFTMELLSEAVKTGWENVIISPLSIQECLAMAFVGADGKTAAELSTGLKLGSLNKEKAASNFKQPNTISGIKIANKIYVPENIKLKPEYNNIARENFNSTAENINFSDPESAAKAINTWVEEQTNNKIQNLIGPSALENTGLLLVSAIHFKDEWENKFEHSLTRKEKFWIDENNSVDVDMMEDENTMKYGESEELDVKAVQIPYKNSKLHLLVIVPNKKSGLRDLENLKEIDLNKIEADMKIEGVSLKMPKFKTEYSMPLNSVLVEMGMKTIFTANADFSHLTDGQVKVDKVYHKALIEVDEEGTEAAAATYSTIVSVSSKQIVFFDKKFLTVDRPFLYFIKDDNIVYFAGRVTKF